jgi:LysR family transcriptional activator of nhaA
MNYNHLNYFYHVARLQSISKAANHLRVSQPSLSSQIKTFEEQLNTKLIQKSGRNIELTSEGQIILKYCEKIFNLTNEMQDYLNKGLVDEKINFKIGITNQVAGPFAADLIYSLKNKYTDKNKISYSIKNESKEELIKKIELGEIDMLLTNTAAYAKGCIEIVNREMPVSLFVESKAYAKMKKQMNFSSVLDIKKLIESKTFSMVIPSRLFSLRQETDFFLNQFSIKPNVIFESDILSSVEKAILDGLGWGFMPDQYLKKELSLNLVKKINTKQRLWNHRLCVVVKSGLENSEVVQQIKTQLEKL